MALTFLLPRPAPLAPKLYHPSIKYQIRVFWLSLYHVWLLWIVHSISCFSIVHLYKSHPLLRCLKKHLGHPVEMRSEHRLKHEECSACEYLFPGQWQQQVIPVKTSVKSWSILCGLTLGAVSLVSINTDRYCNGPFLIGKNTIFSNHNEGTSNVLL